MVFCHAIYFMRKIFCFVWCLVFSCGLLADPKQQMVLKKAELALANSDYSAAYDIYHKLAAKNPLAKFYLGVFYKNGWGRAVDYKKACFWFEQAAKGTIPTAEHEFGECLAHGISSPVDIPKAVYWYERAAIHGHFLSSCFAADYYLRGEGVAKDVGKGLEMCAQAARAASPPAMMKMASFYSAGSDFPSDQAQTRYWLEQAAAHGVLEAQYRLALMLLQGEEGDASRSLFWFEHAANQGYLPAYLGVAVLYANAPVDSTTGALAPEHLAKIYIWAELARKMSGEDTHDHHEAERILELVAKVMPVTWRPDLDRLVAEHIRKFPASVK